MRALVVTLFLLASLFVTALIVFRDKRPKIYFAAKTGDTNYISNYLALGSNINSSITSYKNGRRYASMLHIAAFGGHTNVVDFLLKNGASPNQLDSSGNPPIDWAIAHGSDETSVPIVRMLIEAGADPNLRYESDYRYTPLLRAASLEQTNMVKLLLAKGADIDATNRAGQTALHLAWRRGGVLKILMNANANSNAPDALGNTNQLRSP